MPLAFRNVDARPSDPVETWPYEALVTAVERGGLSDWRRIHSAVQADPWGPVARSLEDYFGYEQPYGVTPLLQRSIAAARAAAEEAEARAVASEVTSLIAASGLSRKDFAARIGTSPSRLSTYASGKVSPAASLLVRMRRVAAAHADRPSSGPSSHPSPPVTRSGGDRG
ncbi:helix-turn-helix domain-containing protein [Arsenicicoccus sp. oral taxon 190]|uniref:helix-turn-helix domain-containing protein n=1 Tax=Arsenicicoccus sp. oral taxon 190 TaxID=1658671 RepID=UPI000A8F95D7|nr:helix-turn-helix transcriptional regulator [Arsenicicoccus sp. oral taxon 190]